MCTYINVFKIHESLLCLPFLIYLLIFFFFFCLVNYCFAIDPFMDAKKNRKDSYERCNIAYKLYVCIVWLNTCNYVFNILLNQKNIENIKFFDQFIVLKKKQYLYTNVVILLYCSRVLKLLIIKHYKY